MVNKKDLALYAAIKNGFRAAQVAIHNTAKEKGWWDEKRNPGEMIALMHSELSEALEGLRKPQQSDHIPGFTLVEEELADCIIRVLDAAAGLELDVNGAMCEKMEFNKTRPHKHGKKF